jgi:hypothetical protein
MSPELVRKSILALQKHWFHIQQATRTLFYMFGLVLFLILQNVGMTVGDGGPGYAADHILGNFVFACAFATNVFFGFLVLHLVQWIVWSRLNATVGSIGLTD